MELAAVYRCVQLISNSIASMPVYRERRGTDGIYKADETDPVNWLLTVAPNPKMSAFDFWRVVTRAALLDGVSYIVPRRNDRGEIRQFDFYRASSTGPSVTYNDLTGKYLVNNINRQGYQPTEILDEPDIIVIRYLTADGVNCLRPGTYAERAVRLAQSAEDETLARVKDGGSPRLILSCENNAFGVGAAVEQQLLDAARYVEYQSRVNKSRVVATSAGVKATQISATSADLQLQSVREFAVREICRFYGVPPQYVYSDGASNYKSAEMAGVDFMTTTLDPILRSIETELRRKLSAPGMGDRYNFDRSSRTAADMITRAKYISSMQGTGAYTVNDIRRIMNMPPLDGGDTPLVSANLRTITDTITNPNQNNNASD